MKGVSLGVLFFFFLSPLLYFFNWEKVFGAPAGGATNQSDTICVPVLKTVWI